MPYFNVYFADTLHFNKEQIGALSALRPWLSAGCQVVLCALADFLGAHTAILVLTWTLSVALRCLLMAMPAHFVAVAGEQKPLCMSCTICRSVMHRWHDVFCHSAQRAAQDKVCMQGLQ